MGMKIFLISFLAFVCLPSLNFASECEFSGYTWRLLHGSHKYKRPGVKSNAECKKICDDVAPIERLEKLYCVFWQLDDSNFCHLHYVAPNFVAPDVTYGISFCKKGSTVLENMLLFYNILPTDYAPSCKEFKGTGRLVDRKVFTLSKDECKKNCEIMSGALCLVWQFNAKNGDCQLSVLTETRVNGKGYGMSLCKNQGYQQATATCKCGIPNAVSTSRMYGGKDAIKDQFPWQVLVEAKSKSMAAGQVYQCGGTLISDSTILTAAHCLYKIHRTGSLEYEDAQTVSVHVTMFNKGKDEYDGQKLVARYWFQYGNFLPNGLDEQDDIAMIILNVRIPFSDKIRPICLPGGNENFSGGIYEHEVGHMLGWGNLKETMEESKTQKNKWEIQEEKAKKLQESFVNILTFEQCKSDYYTEMCAIGKNNEQACKGDSGGPLMIKSFLTGQYFQAGVIASVPLFIKKGKPAGKPATGLRFRLCGDKNVKTYFTRTSSYLKWIKEKWTWYDAQGQPTQPYCDK